jgi:uncharacterized protein (DUF1800 family)
MASLTPINGQLGFRNAAHLLRRATFGPTRSNILQFANYTASQALDVLFSTTTTPLPPVDPLTGSNWLPAPVDGVNSDDSALFTYFKAWFIELMRNEGTNIRERLVYFLHSHLPADYNLILNATSLYYQNVLLRRYSLGNFKTLFAKICVDNAMLYYIDNTLNDMDSPNENFAREMLELYTIGKGDQIGPEDYTNYTETDIKQAARVLTGIKHNFDFDTIDPDTNIPRGKVSLSATLQAERHDAGTKTFTNKFNSVSISPNPAMMINGFASEEGFFDEINQMMDMIFDQPETAKFICRKLYRFFVYYNITPEIETDIITPLAETFRSNNYLLDPVIRQLLESQHFYDTDTAPTSDNNIGALIKAPIDLLVGTLKYLKINMPTNIQDLYVGAYEGGILQALDDQGQDFYRPIDVAGYPPYHQEPAYNRNWISPNWLANRYLFITTLLNGIKDKNQNIVCQLVMTDFVKDSSNISNPANAETIVTELVDSLLPVEIPTERYNYFLNTVFLNGTSTTDWTDEWNKYIGGSSDGSLVKTYLDRLITGILQSPEYQLF